MPLSFNLRDEENQRINNIMKRLIALEFVPDNFPGIDIELAQFGLLIDSLSEFSDEQIIAHLEKTHFDWPNAESFADWLSTVKMPEKAIAVYEFIQRESHIFSVAIFNKINSLKL